MTNAERAPSGWIPVLLAIAVNAWVLAMPFQADDYLILPEVGAILGIEQKAAPSDDPRADAHIGNFYLFRPVPWFIWWVTIKAHGGLADPVVFHAVALLFHAATTFLLWRVLRAVFRPSAAVIGASAFAIAPGAVQATSWIAAGGDQLAVLFMLLSALALQQHRVKPTFRKAVAAAACAALAFCSKEVAIASVPAVLLAAWAVPSPARVRMWRSIAFVGAGVAIGIAGRALYLKSMMPAYLGAPQVGWSSLLMLDDLFLEFLMPWRRGPGLEALPPVSARIAARLFAGDGLAGLRIASLVFFGLPIVGGICLAPLRVAAIAVALVCVLVPALVIFHETSTQIVSRALYAASALCGALLAAGIEPLLDAGTRRRIAIALLVPLAVLWADFMVHVARTELLAAKIIDDRIDSMLELTRGIPPETRVLASDLHFELGGIPLVIFGMGHAMEPPFVPVRRARVTWWDDLATLPRSPILHDEPGPIVIARLSEGRYVEREPRIPALPAELPKMARSPADTTEWRFDAAIPARAVAGIRVASGSQGVFQCRWIGSRGTRETRGALPGLGAASSTIVSAPEDFDWLSDPVILGVRIEGAIVETVEPMRALPEIRIVTPEKGARIPRTTVPEISFQPPEQPASQDYRLTIEFAISHDERPMMISEEPAFVLQERPLGVRAFDVARQRVATFVASPPTDATRLFRRLDEVLRVSGSHLVPMSIRLEGFDPRSGSVECRSRWRMCFLQLEK